MDELISRQAAIDAVYKNDRCTTIKQRLEALPTIQPEPHWIPVTEMLPAIGKSVLMCDIDGDIYLGHRTRWGYYYPDFCDDKIKDVRAWRELPEPYKGGLNDRCINGRTPDTEKVL